MRSQRSSGCTSGACVTATDHFARLEKAAQRSEAKALTVHRFANDFKLPLDTGAKQLIILKVIKRFSINESPDALGGVAHVE